MKQLIESQRNFFNSNATKDIGFRKQQLQKLEDALKSNEQLMYDAIYKDFKKSEFDTYTTELALLYSDIKEAKKKVEK
jgi:aldehyde dehydrogenase (NAD+)